MSTSATFPAAAVLLVAEIISGLGAIRCLFGLPFTTPCAVAVTAATVTWYERPVLAGGVAVAGSPDESSGGEKSRNHRVVFPLALLRRG